MAKSQKSKNKSMAIHASGTVGKNIGEAIGARFGFGDRGRQIGRKVGKFVAKAGLSKGPQRRKINRAFKSIKGAFKKGPRNE